MNSRLLIINLIGVFLFSCEVTADELENTGKDCWRNCNRQQGPCDWCGSKGFCCTKKDNWTDTSFGCDGSFGGETRHECALKLDQGPYCATEGQICKCHGKVKYGRDENWTAEKDVVGSINCTNEEFGDPKPYFKKECLCTPMGEKVCKKFIDCKNMSNFCDFSYGDSGTCVPCPSGGTDCASYLSSDMKKGKRACNFRCDKTDWTPPARTTKNNNFKKTQSTTSQMTQSIWKKIYSNMKFHHNSLKYFISEFSWLLCSFQGDLTITQKLISWNALRLNY